MYAMTANACEAVKPLPHNFAMPKVHTTLREVWHFKGAAWQNMRSMLRNTSWDFLRDGDCGAILGGGGRDGGAAAV